MEILNKEYNIIIEVTHGSSGLQASTRFNFEKYISEPVAFDSLEKFRRIHNRLGHRLEITKNSIILEYKDDDFDFNLRFVMQNVNNNDSEIAALKTRIQELETKLYSDLPVRQKVIQFWCTKNGIHMNHRDEYFEKLMLLMPYAVHPTHNSESVPWTSVYADLPTALKHAGEHYFMINHQPQHNNILRFLSDFILKIPYMVIRMDLIEEAYRPFWWNNFADSFHQKAKKADILVAKVTIIAKPPYSVHAYETEEDKKEYRSFINSQLIKLGDIWKGFCQETQIGNKMILWNYDCDQ